MAIQALRRRAAGLLLAPVLLSACASMPSDATLISSESISGRLSVSVEATASTAAHGVSATFALHGNPSQGQLDLSTPLGTVLAQAKWRPDRVVLVTSEGEVAYPDLDALTRKMMGAPLPVAALFDWLRGRPWPGADSRPTASGFEQLGWQVDRSQLSGQRLSAVRTAPPVVTVRVRMDGDS